jgi:hypothetical protein
VIGYFLLVIERRDNGKLKMGNHQWQIGFAENRGGAQANLKV